MLCATATDYLYKTMNFLIFIFHCSEFQFSLKFVSCEHSPACLASHVLNTDVMTMILNLAASRYNSEALKNKRHRILTKENGMKINWWLDLCYSHCANCPHRQAVWPQSSACYKIIMYQLTGFISKLHWLSCHHCQILHIKRTVVNTMSENVHSSIWLSLATNDGFMWAW
jgi:hypothetical protein